MGAPEASPSTRPRGGRGGGGRGGGGGGGLSLLFFRYLGGFVLLQASLNIYLHREGLVPLGASSGGGGGGRGGGRGSVGGSALAPGAGAGAGAGAAAEPAGHGILAPPRLPSLPSLLRGLPARGPGSSPPTSPYAYAFLISGCGTEGGGGSWTGTGPGWSGTAPARCRGEALGVLASARVLAEAGSRADVVALIRISSGLDDPSSSSSVEGEWLRSAGVVVRYLDGGGDDGGNGNGNGNGSGGTHAGAGGGGGTTTYAARLDRFRVLELAEYRRVMFLEPDVLPLCNLDYLFELSDADADADAGEGKGKGSGGGGADVPPPSPPLLRENLLVAGWDGPAGAGIFVLRPGEGELDELRRTIVERRGEEEEMEMMEEGRERRPRWPPFDELGGWGHVIAAPDRWRAAGKEGGGGGGGGIMWDFPGSFAEQGLLYMWAKYHKRSVSIVVGGELETWTAAEEEEEGGMGGSGEVRLEGVRTGALDRRSCSPRDPFRRGRYYDHAPYRDFHRFEGSELPWLPRPAGQGRANGVPGDVPGREGAGDPTELWYYGLRRQISAHGLDIDMHHLTRGAAPPG